MRKKRVDQRATLLRREGKGAETIQRRIGAGILDSTSQPWMPQAREHE
jgi:hypothetical protein